MSRDLPADLIEDFENSEVSPFFASEVFPFFAIELFFDNNETIRLWTGIGDITVEGETYSGTGTILQVSDVEETAEIAASGATLVLSAVPQNIVSLALSEPYQGRTCKIYFGSIDDGDLNNITLYTEIFSGYMDTMDITDDGETSRIELKATNKLVDLERPRVARYTSAYQKYLYPDDKGFDFVESLQEKVVYWGRT